MLSFQSIRSNDGDRMTSEILCLVSGLIVFIAFFSAVFTQTITSFSFFQVCKFV